MLAKTQQMISPQSLSVICQTTHDDNFVVRGLCRLTLIEMKPTAAWEEADRSKDWSWYHVPYTRSRKPVGHLTVQSQQQQHEEEECRPQRSHRHQTNRHRIRNEGQTWTWNTHRGRRVGCFIYFCNTASSSSHASRFISNILSSFYSSVKTTIITPLEQLLAWDLFKCLSDDFLSHLVVLLCLIFNLFSMFSSSFMFTFISMNVCLTVVCTKELLSVDQPVWVEAERMNKVVTLCEIFFYNYWFFFTYKHLESLKSDL